MPHGWTPQPEYTITDGGALFAGADFSRRLPKCAITDSGGKVGWRIQAPTAVRLSEFWFDEWHTEALTCKSTA
jgi:hypothetical protein